MRRMAPASEQRDAAGASRRSQRTPSTGGDGPELPIAPWRSMAQLDPRERANAIAGLQATAGNGAVAARMARTVQREPSDDDIPPNPYVIETPGGGAVPQIPANPYATENDPVTLANARFAGNPRLERIAGGGAPLSAADNGPAVRAVQGALRALGFELVFHGDDSQFGTETRQAISGFRARRSMPDGELTARALGELDSTAPAPGEQEEHEFDYERLFADGYLDVTVAVGFDENGSQADQLKHAHDWLSDRGFEARPATPGQPEQYRLRRDVTYPTRDGNRLTREVVVRFNLISPGPGAARQYGQALADSEITVYDGHARRGIGPDFDADSSPAENFVIGVASALHAAGRAIEPSAVEQHHYVIDRKNDLERMTQSGQFDKEKYRIWFFNACTTLAYFDELRGGILPGTMDRQNLDLLGTQSPMPLISEMPATLAMLDGVLAADTMEAIVRSMARAATAVIDAIPESELSGAQRAEVRNWAQGAVVHEGAGDNPVAPRP